MAERKITTNTFGEGLIMDFAPDNTPNTSLSNALNATLLTYNGNEMSLLNDMGNGRVESAYLPEGYIPVGVCEFGDIIYIASYNPLINKSLIGCFPSPERNISNKEISDLNTTFSSDELAKDGTIVNSNIKKIIFGNKNIGPGDKFIISWGEEGLNNRDYISNFGNTTQSFAEGESYWPKLVKVHIVSIQDDGKLIYLDNDVQWYPTRDDYSDKDKKADKSKDMDNSFPISTKEFLLGDEIRNDLHNLDEYRYALNCQYSVFQQKVSGKLGILLELESINNFNCGHKVFRRNHKTEDGKEEEVFDIYFSASWDTDNYNINPSGIIITESNLKNMSLVKEETFVNKKTSEETSEETLEKTTITYKNYLTASGKDKYKRDRMIEFTRLYKLEEPGKTYEDFKNNSYYTKVKNYLSFHVPGSIEYKDIPKLSTDLSVLGKVDVAVPAEPASSKKNSKTLTNNTDNPNIEKPLSTIYNYRPLIKNIIRAYEAKDDCKVPMTITKEYEETKEDKKIKKSTTLGAYYFNPEQIKEGKYITTINGTEVVLQPEAVTDDVVVNTFKRPVLVKVATVKKDKLEGNAADAEFYIDYTVCPCMPYGILDHLAVSNTINFNKDLDGSVNLDTWKYYVNADSITLNYGLTTNLKEDENEVVDKVVMEFYDNQGLSASYEIKNLDTFDAKFTEYIELDQESSNYKILNTRIPENSISRDLTELIPHAGEYAGLCVKDIKDDDPTKYVYFDKDLKVRSAADLFNKDIDPNITSDTIEEPEIHKDDPTEPAELSEGDEEYHVSYTLEKTTSECLKSITYDLKYDKGINTLENLDSIRESIFHGTEFTQFNKEVFKIDGNNIKWIGETIPDNTKYYFILGKHGETSYTSAEFKSFMEFSASNLDFIIVYYYNLSGGINLYYTTVSLDDVKTECPIIKIDHSDSSLTELTKYIKFKVNAINPKNDENVKINSIIVTGADKTTNENNEECYIINNNVAKDNIYRATASVETDDWITSISFYFIVYTEIKAPVTSEPEPGQEPEPVNIAFGSGVIEYNGNSFIQYEPSTDKVIADYDVPEAYGHNDYNICPGADPGNYFTLDNRTEGLYLESNKDIFYKVITPLELFILEEWKPLKGNSETVISTSEDSKIAYLGIITKTENALELTTFVYKINIEQPEKPYFTWEGIYLDNGDVRLIITSDADITYDNISINPFVKNEKINDGKSITYTLKNPNINKYEGTIHLKTLGYNINNSFNFEIKSNSQGEPEITSDIKISFGTYSTEPTGSKITINDWGTDLISLSQLPEEYQEGYEINSNNVSIYYTLEQNRLGLVTLDNYGKLENYEEVVVLYLVINEKSSFDYNKWRSLGLGHHAIVAESTSPGTYYLGILVPIGNIAKIAVYKIIVNNSQPPVFEWSGKYLSNGDIQLTVTPNTDITYASISTSPLVTSERTDKNGSLIYTLINPNIGDYTGTISLETRDYYIKNTFSFKIKSNSLGGSDLSRGIPTIKWQYPSKTFIGELFIKFGVNGNGCNEYHTTLTIEDQDGERYEYLGKEFNGEKSIKISKHNGVAPGNIDSTKVTVIITKYDGTILNSDSREYVISLDDLPVYPNNAGILYYGRPYYVLIKIFKARLDELGNKDMQNYETPIIYQRWLWTAPIFNDKYTTYSDFKDCQFLVGLDFVGYLNGKGLSDQISSKILLPKCLMDNYPKDSEFKVTDSIGANVNIIGNLTDPNILFNGIPIISDTCGNSIFLSNKSYKNISVSIGLGNKRVLIDDTEVKLQDSDEDYSLPSLLPKSSDPNSSVVEYSNPIEGEDNFNLELSFKNYRPIKTTESFRYYDSTGLNIREGTFDMYTIDAEYWIPEEEKIKIGNPLLRLYGVKYNKMAAKERILLDSYKRIRPIIETADDFEQYGLSINNGKPYYSKIPYLGFSENKGGGTKTHLTCGYLEYTSAYDDNPRLYIKFYDKIDGNPFKGEFQHEKLYKFLENISTSLVQLIILGRGCRIGNMFKNDADGVDGDSIRSPSPYRLTSRMGRNDKKYTDRIMGYKTGDKDYFPYPYNLVEDIDKHSKYSQDIDRYNCNVNTERFGEPNVYDELMTYPGMAAFSTTNKNDTFYTYTLLGILDVANGLVGTADGGILKSVRKTGGVNFSQNFAWNINASDIHRNNVKNYAQIVASLLSQIYVLSDSEKDHYILLNLVKLNKYNEAWRADILVKLQCKTKNEKNSSKFINIIPKKFTYGESTYVGINLFAFAAAAQYNALHPVDKDGNKIPLESYATSKTFKFNDENNINPEFSDLVKCVEFSYDLPYDLGDLETQCYNSNFASLNFLQNIHKDENEVLYKSIPVSLTLNADQLYVFNGGKFIPFNHGSNIYLIDKFVDPKNLGTLFGIISKYQNNLIKLELNRSSNIHGALAYDGARLIFKDITKLQGYNSEYTWILRTHGDDPELRGLKNINLFNYGKLI